MKPHFSFVMLALICAPLAARAQILLSLDFDERNVVPQTQGGFSSFLITSNSSATTAQTTPTVRAFDAYTVTMEGLGNPAYDDRVRTAPTDGGALTQASIYRDFVFQSSATNGDGLAVTIDGLVADDFHKITIWSYDNSSGGNRVSDWYANGALVRAGYTFAGGAAGVPTTNEQYQLSFTVPADGTGRIAIQGRRNAATSSAGGVFLNALQIEVAAPDPPGFAAGPQAVTLYEGDNAILSASPVGSPPLSLQWYQGEIPVEDATNATLVLFANTAATAGDYSVVASSPHGPSVTNGPVAVTVLPVADLASGLLAHWSLDAFDPGDPAVIDHSPYANDLALAAMDVSNIDFGRHGTSLLFNGVDEYLTRTNDYASLPAYQYPGYTVALWVRGNGVGQSDRRVWAESSNTNTTPIVDIGTVPGGTNGTVDIFIRQNAGGGINHRQTALVAFDGNWHHIAWVDNNGYGRVYVDGVPDTNQFNYTRAPLSADAMCLGCVARTNGGIVQFAGNIDDVFIWRRSLSEAEVRTVMDRVRILSLNPGGPSAVISYVTATPAASHRVQEKTNIDDAWADTAGVVIANTGPDTYSATFPSAGGGQKFYRVVSP